MEEATPAPQQLLEPAQPPARAPRWLRVLPLILALIAVGAGIKLLQGDDVSASVLPGASASTYQFTAGTPAPDFKLETLDGQRVSLRDFRGRPVMLNFWATWCPPCRSEMPDMENVYGELKSKDLVILAVNVQEARAPVDKFVQQFGLTFPILMDFNGDVVQQYGVISLPTSYFIDKEGRISSFSFGALNRSAMLRRLEPIL
ncbi:MAG: redoxin domain-containing protein [Chloroflexi bacterium]|nr:redoxin domain-containing protein [Chloroflexota bacterium]